MNKCPHCHRIYEPQDDQRPTVAMAAQFHQAFGISHFCVPTLANEERYELRVRLFMEELTEFRDAYEAENMLEIFDALCDMQYVLDGTFCEFGLEHLKQAGCAEVHRSNMSKLGNDGLPIIRGDGKVLKGPNYFRPDLATVLRGRKDDLTSEYIGPFAPPGFPTFVQAFKAKFAPLRMWFWKRKNNL